MHLVFMALGARSRKRPNADPLTSLVNSVARETASGGFAGFSRFFEVFLEVRLMVEDDPRAFSEGVVSKVGMPVTKALKCGFMANLTLSGGHFGQIMKAPLVFYVAARTGELCFASLWRERVESRAKKTQFDTSRDGPVQGIFVLPMTRVSRRDQFGCGERMRI